MVVCDGLSTHNTDKTDDNNRSRTSKMRETLFDFLIKCARPFDLMEIDCIKVGEGTTPSLHLTLLSPSLFVLLLATACCGLFLENRKSVGQHCLARSKLLLVLCATAQHSVLSIVSVKIWLVS